jgi:uncharacterized protein (DUF427 family)
MTRAIWEDTVLAESNDTIVVEGNHYFPPASIEEVYFEPSDTRTVCPWKGQAHYYSIVIGDRKNKDAAWTYPDAKEAAKNFENYVAFWKGVQVVDDGS